MLFFLMSQGSLNQKIRFLGQKMCLARVRTDTHTHTQTDTHESDYCGYPFKVSGVFPSTDHQGSTQHVMNDSKKTSFDKYDNSPLY